MWISGSLCPLFDVCGLLGELAHRMACCVNSHAVPLICLNISESLLHCNRKSRLSGLNVLSINVILSGSVWIRSLRHPVAVSTGRNLSWLPLLLVAEKYFSSLFSARAMAVVHLLGRIPCFVGTVCPFALLLRLGSVPCFVGTVCRSI